jgi:uncharacterized protein YjbJ (UPF0337 family)
MNWDQIEGSWKQAMRKAREKWDKLTDDDLQQVAGKRDQLVRKLQERYGIVRQEAQRQVEEWARSLREENQAERETEFHTARR